LPSIERREKKGEGEEPSYVVPTYSRIETKKREGKRGGKDYPKTHVKVGGGEKGGKGPVQKKKS